MRVLVLALMSLCSMASAQRNEQVMARVARIEATLRETRYQHRTDVDVARGRYRFDCSGMVTWILRSSAPGAARGLGASRPVARTYARAIARAPANGQRRGWRRIERWQDVRPGDVFAFERPGWWPSRNTGHTGIVVSPLRWAGPGTSAGEIVDSTDLSHGGDGRALGGRGGFGRATMSFHGLRGLGGDFAGFGWFGPLGPVMWQRVFIGRPMR
ncbi:MAG: hypothetical protein IT378_16530 [Sandaracinaceae bacterium]|nr:hypothetical protein [Sandaracinaceae bacterium]